MGLLVVGTAIVLKHAQDTIVLLKLLRSLNLSSGPLSHEDKQAAAKRIQRAQIVFVGIFLFASVAASVGIVIHASKA